MALFYPLRVSDIRKETADCVSVAFTVPNTLKDKFSFTQGQYITLRTTIAGEEVRRSYSLCVSPLDEELRVAIKQVPDGKFSTFANQTLQVGDEIEVMPPDGRFFTPLSPDNKNHYVAFAAGSGITPILSILTTVLQTEPNSHFTLFYGNQRTESIIFREAIEALKNRYIGRLSVYYLLSREHTGSELFSGRIDKERCQIFCKKLFDPTSINAYFLCGPEQMVLDVREELLGRGVDRSNVHLELFGTSRKRAVTTSTITDTDFNAAIKLQLDGNIINFNMTDPQESILDAALRNGADLPFACKGGVCCTCRAKIESGDTEMLVNYALEPDEVENGFVLSCQALPRSEEISITFDA